MVGDCYRCKDCDDFVLCPALTFACCRSFGSPLKSFADPVGECYKQREDQRCKAACEKPPVTCGCARLVRLGLVRTGILRVTTLCPSASCQVQIPELRIVAYAGEPKRQGQGTSTGQGPSANSTGSLLTVEASTGAHVAKNCTTGCIPGLGATDGSSELGVRRNPLTLDTYRVRFSPSLFLRHGRQWRLLLSRRPTLRQQLPRRRKDLRNRGNMSLYLVLLLVRNWF